MAAVCLWVVCGLQSQKATPFQVWIKLVPVETWLVITLLLLELLTPGFNVGLLIIKNKTPFCLMLILKHMSVYKNHLSHFTASKVFWINILQCSLTQSYKYWPYLCLFVLNQGCHVHIYSFWYLNMRRRRAISAGHLSILYRIK